MTAGDTIAELLLINLRTTRWEVFIESHVVTDEGDSGSEE